MTLSNNTLVKYIILTDINTVIVTRPTLASRRRDYPDFNQLSMVICESISVEYIDNGALGLSYWIDNKPVYREYSGGYDFIKIEADEYTVKDWLREQNLGLIKPAGKG